MRKIKVAELVFDFDLYPRNNVDSQHVTNIVDAIATGVEIPPVVIDKKSSRIIDGFHRGRAWIKHFGEDSEIPVIEKTYKDDASMFMDAMRYNSSHGVKLDACDRNHCVIIGERLGLSVDLIAGALNMPSEKLGSLNATRTAKNRGGLQVPLKRTVSKQFSGKKLTRRQEEANRKLSGMNQVFYANQLIELIESDMLDTSDENLMARIGVLHEYLDAILITT